MGVINIIEPLKKRILKRIKKLKIMEKVEMVDFEYASEYEKFSEDKLLLGLHVGTLDREEASAIKRWMSGERSGSLYLIMAKLMVRDAEKTSKFQKNNV